MSKKVQLSFTEWIDAFMYHCQSQQLRTRTLQAYEQALVLFSRWLECKDITHTEQVTQGIVEGYIEDVQTRGKYTVLADDKSHTTNYPNRRRDYRNQVSTTTINNYIRCLKVFFNWLYNEDHIKQNPMAKIKQIKNERQPKDFISDNDYKKLLSILDKSYFNEFRDFTIINLIMDTGMRIGECTRLLMDDIDLIGHAINIRAEETKGRKDRTVFFSVKMLRMLQMWIRYKDRYVDSDYLFCTKANVSNVTVSGFESNFKSYIKRAGLKNTISPHTLRNNFAKRCLMNGMDIYTLSRLLGHSSVKVTEKAYLDLTPNDLKERYYKFSPLSNIK